MLGINFTLQLPCLSCIMCSHMKLVGILCLFFGIVIVSHNIPYISVLLHYHVTFVIQVNSNKKKSLFKRLLIINTGSKIKQIDYRKCSFRKKMSLVTLH